MRVCAYLLALDMQSGDLEVLVPCRCLSLHPFQAMAPSFISIIGFQYCAPCLPLGSMSAAEACQGFPRTGGGAGGREGRGRGTSGAVGGNAGAEWDVQVGWLVATHLQAPYRKRQYSVWERGSSVVSWLQRQHCC